jgi:polysaccharide biosynthesis/export protein
LERARILTGTSRFSGVSLALLLASLGLTGALACLTGCDTQSLGDPTEMGRLQYEPLVTPILTQVDPGVEGKSDEFTEAVAPTPDDLIPAAGDYKISPNDLLEVTIADLQAPNVDTFRRMRVSETGNINLPYLGQVKAEGLTEAELTSVIGDDYKRQGFLNNANVTVQVVEAQGRAFEIRGAVAAPGEYAITRANFRMLDALVTARDPVSPLIEYAYVIRQIKPSESTTPPTEPAPASGGGSPNLVPATGPSNDDLAPHSDAGNIANQPLNVLSDPPPSPPSNNPLIDLAESSTQPSTQPATAPEASTESSNESASGGTEASTEPGGNFEFNTPVPQDYRIIRIPLIQLTNGQLQYNIVIRPHDLIIVQNLPIGNYYMSGHVARPGAYTLAGTRVTVRQAIEAAAGLDALGIPQRTELVRRINPNAQLIARIDLYKIFNGEEPDFYLKPDDQIQVGTNAIAPFLAAVRGSFRITYGFGFLYDRNFSVPDNVSQ